MSIDAMLTITLGISGPFLCGATAPVSWGVDATFDRDYLGRPFIDRSHVKGKLREAWGEIGKAEFANEMLGREDGGIGRLDLPNFYLLDNNLENSLTMTVSERRLTRIRMEADRGVVNPNALLVMEDAFPGAESRRYQWEGVARFFATKKGEAENIQAQVSLALKWITAFGSEKGIGFGRLRTVQVALSTKDVTLTPDATAGGDGKFPLTLRIHAEEPLFFGEVRRKNNYQESREYATGANLKGALAQAINEALLVTNPTAAPTGEGNTMFPLLGKYYSAIRFIHALPSRDGKRPVVVPFSVVSAGERFHDDEDEGLIGGRVPAFQTDWKQGTWPDGFGWATPRRWGKTRTAIEKDRRTSETGKMFTYRYVCPVDGEGKDVMWVGGVYLDEKVLRNGDKAASVRKELESALALVRRLGKRGGRIKSIEVTDGAPPAFRPGSAPATQGADPAQTERNNPAILVLQSDTLMVDPVELLNGKQTAETLKNLYAAYWGDVLKDKFKSLTRFFAMQKLLGGYMRRRMTVKNYYPFYLTAAGSVFVLELNNGGWNRIEELLREGLPLPKWCHDRREDSWKTNPFVPENGFGEVIAYATPLSFEKGGDTGGDNHE